MALEPAAKRICTISPAPRHSPAHPLPLNTQIHPTPPPLQHYALDDIAAPHILHREHSQRMLEIRELKDRPRLPGMTSWEHDCGYFIASILVVTFNLSRG